MSETLPPLNSGLPSLPKEESKNDQKSNQENTTKTNIQTQNTSVSEDMPITPGYRNLIVVLACIFLLLIVGIIFLLIKASSNNVPNQPSYSNTALHPIINNPNSYAISSSSSSITSSSSSLITDPITAVQMANRDSQRQTALVDISLAMQQNYQNYRSYTSPIWQSNGTITFPLPSGVKGTASKLTLKGAAIGIVGTLSTSTGSVYCFGLSKDGSSFTVGVKLEQTGQFKYSANSNTSINCNPVTYSP